MRRLYRSVQRGVPPVCRSCATPLVFGCTYSDADNYNAAADSEDGSCEFSGGSSCLTDIDGDGATAVGDLLIILGAFGQTCEE